MSKPNLPPLPTVRIGGKEMSQVWFRAHEVRAYAEEAVRQALEQAAIKAVETLKGLTTEMEGYSYFGSNPGVKEDDYEDVAEAIRALLPEKDHGEST